MNIFFLSFIVAEAARDHIDVHVVKMILETAQLLFSVHYAVDSTELKTRQQNNLKVYRKTHSNHPSAIWVRTSIEHYWWLSELGLALCSEYTRRYKKVHSTEELLQWLYDNVPDLPDIPFSYPPQAMPDVYKNDDCVTAYRQYYVGAKSKLGRFGYKDGYLPDWWEEIKEKVDKLDIPEETTKEKKKSIQCLGNTKSGERCKNKCVTGYCHLHTIN